MRREVRVEENTSIPDREPYEAPALRELGAMEELTAGRDDGSILDTTVTG